MSEGLGIGERWHWDVSSDRGKIQSTSGGFCIPSLQGTSRDGSDVKPILQQSRPISREYHGFRIGIEHNYGHWRNSCARGDDTEEMERRKEGEWNLGAGRRPVTRNYCARFSSLSILGSVDDAVQHISFNTESKGIVCFC